MKIIIDSREQRPFTFSSPWYQDKNIEIVTGTLDTGDYSLHGLESVVSVERKSIEDLVACLGTSRDRFLRELERARGLESFAVVVEGSWSDLAGGKYRSKLNPHSACQSVLSFSARLHIPFLFAGSRASAEYATWGFLRQYLEGARRRLEKIVKAHDAA